MTGVTAISSEDEEPRALDFASLVDPRILLITGGGVGLAPAAPGTVGSIVAALVWWFLIARLDVASSLAIILAVFLLGTWAIHVVERQRGLGDAGAIIVDEFVGCWLALCFVESWPGAIAAVVLFRVLDIVKPGPIGWADRQLKGGWGVMADDIIAGVVAGAIVVAGEIGVIALGVV